MSSRNGKRPRNKAKPRRKPRKPPPTAAVAVSPLNGATIPLGAHPGNTGGKPGRSGRHLSITKRLAARKLPKHVRTLDLIANGETVVTITERCPKCGHEASTSELTPVRPGEQIHAIEALRKLAEGAELVITSENADSFFNCVSRAIKEIVEPHQVDIIHDRARELFRATRKAAAS